MYIAALSYLKKSFLSRNIDPYKSKMSSFKYIWNIYLQIYITNSNISVNALVETMTSCRWSRVLRSHNILGLSPSGIGHFLQAGIIAPPPLKATWPPQLHHIHHSRNLVISTAAPISKNFAVWLRDPTGKAGHIQVMKVSRPAPGF